MINISKFAQQNLNWARTTPPDKMASIGASYKMELRKLAVPITCKVDEIMLQLLNNESDFFIFSEFNFVTCIRRGLGY